MKKFLLLALLYFLAISFAFSQVLCVECFKQNERVGTTNINYILNGSFEDGCLENQSFATNSLSQNCTLTNWTTYGGPNTYAGVRGINANMVVDGQLDAYMGNLYCFTCSNVANDTSCLINSNCTVTGIPANFPKPDSGYGGSQGTYIEQTVNGLFTGNTYILEFWVGGESSFGALGIFAVNVGFGNIFLRCNNTPPGEIGRRYIIKFTTNSPAPSIRFTNWGHIAIGATEAIIDDVRLYPAIQVPGTVTPCAVGIEELENKGIDVFTASNQIMVLPNNQQELRLKVFDVIGRMQHIQQFKGNLTVDALAWPPGVYLYQVESEKGVLRNGRFVKE